jgi:predicted Zn-dependent protease
MKKPAHCLKSSVIVGLILVLGLYFQAEAYAGGELPLLGENSAINIEQEKRIGHTFYRRLLAQGVVETNPILHSYLNELGARLLSNLDLRLRDYHFFIVKDLSVNAFAVPGGYIGVNVGLILRAQNQDQLASVLAHEISHVRLMHGLQLMEKAGGVGNASIITMLAGILLSGISPELGSAVLFGGIAGSEQAMINYTREFEYEADRLGIELLQGGNFDPQGMVDFFRMMERISGNSEFQSIEYLRTHPVNDNRISEVENRIRSMTVARSGSDYFQMFRDYLFYLSLDRMDYTGSEFRKALAKSKMGEFEQANLSLEKLYQQDSENVWYGYVYAENLENLNQLDEARQVYRKLLEIFPDEFALSLRFIRLLKSAGDFDSALVIARRLEKRFPSEKRVYKELSEIYNKLQQPIYRMMAEAEYHRLSGNYQLAINLYDTVIGSPQTNDATESRAMAKRAEISR